MLVKAVLASTSREPIGLTNLPWGLRLCRAALGTVLYKTALYEYSRIGVPLQMAARILIVDDIESNLLALEALIGDADATIVRARSGAEALRALETDEFSLVVLDVQMPEMDGFETAAAIRRDTRTNTLPIIFVTAFDATREKLAKAYAVGAIDLLAKPLDPSALQAKVRAITDAWRRIDDVKRAAASQQERRLAEERQRWEREALLARVAEQEKATATERAARVEAEQANELKDEFLATLSHELRTPLNAILGWTSILRKRAAGNPSFGRGLEVIERNATAQAKLIEDLLDVSRVTAGKLRLDVRTVNLTEILELLVEAIRPEADQKGIAIATALSSGVPLLAGDPDRLRQVFSNIISNAVKFTPDGGGVEIRLVREGTRAVTVVKDTGIGISRDFLPHVFGRFRQGEAGFDRPYGGLGIGLSLASQLVELHGGAIKAESSGPGQGSTFTVSLPIRAVAPPAPGAPRTGADSDSPVSVPNARVLVVDDEPDARELVREVLEEAGAAVLAVESATLGLQAISSWRPNVVVSDIGMPGEDGYAFLQRLRALPPEAGGRIPAIALTAYASVDDGARARTAGFDIHIPKPVEPRRLLSTIRMLVSASESAD